MSDKPNSHKKGERNERQARRILSRKYKAERVPSIYGNNDPFRLADVMGLQSGLPFAIIQVKTNRFTAEQRRSYSSRASLKIDDEHTIFEVWIREDRTGWEMRRYDVGTGEFVTYFETSICDPSNVRDDWADAFEELL